MKWFFYFFGLVPLHCAFFHRGRRGEGRGDGTIKEAPEDRARAAGMDSSPGFGAFYLNLTRFSCTGPGRFMTERFYGGIETIRQP